MILKYHIFFFRKKSNIKISEKIFDKNSLQINQRFHIIKQSLPIKKFDIKICEKIFQY